MARLVPYSLIFVLIVLAGPLQADTQLDEIESLLGAGKFQPALTRLDAIVAKDRDNPRYRFALARALAGQGQQAKAIEQYEAMIKRYPKLPEPYNNLAVIYARQGQHEKARELLGQAMGTHPGYARIYKNLLAVNTAHAQDAYAKALQIPAARQETNLLVADQLSLPEKPAPVDKAVPVVTALAKPALVYQAETGQADKKKGDHTLSVAQSSETVTQVRTVLQAWAKAWSTKNLDQYLHFYSDDYAPAGMTHSDWVTQRRDRLSRPRWIQVTLHNLQVTEAGAQRLRVRLEQEYAADNYRDLTRKEFVLQEIAGQWRIIQERGLGYIVR